VRGASLRTRVIAAAALLVALISLLTAVLGTTLLHSYLLSRSDAQLRDFAKVASRIVERQQLQSGDSSRAEALPTQFLVEVIAADGQISVAGGRRSLATPEHRSPLLPPTPRGALGASCYSG
jgi:hypothetical protein